MLGTVEALSHPNPKIALVNRIFKDVVTLDQMQRIQALQQSPKGYDPFVRESQEVQRMMDSLSILSINNEAQQKRIASMKVLLHERDKLFFDYLSLRARLSKNDTLIQQLKDLSGIISDSAFKKLNSNLVTTEKKVVTTTVEHEDTVGAEERQSFWDKLFGRRKPTGKLVEKLVKEELNVKLDTLAMDKKDSIMRALSYTVATEQELRIKRRNALIYRQLKLTRENSVLIGHLLNTLREVENEEKQNAELNNYKATQLAANYLNTMDAILVLFIISTLVLICLIIIDITRSNKYRKELIIAKDEAEQLSRIKQRFLSNMSHELRTPLQAIIGVAEQMKLRGASEHNEVNVVYQSSQHLLQIVNEVLDYSRIISGRFQYDKQPFNMRSVLTEVINSMQLQAQQKGLAFTFETNVSFEENYLGDSFRLKQILYNLLGNAIKFTEHGSISLLAEHINRGDEGQFIFTIKDTGIGLSQEEVDRIFIEFETLNNVHTQKGSGLGLNIVKSLVEGQGGTIQISSSKGQGSSFIVTLTYTKAEEVVAGANNDISPLDYKGTVWLVDDDAFILDLCETIFKKYNIAYRMFNNPQQVLHAKVDKDLEIVFLDIRLPVMSGVELCKALQQNSAFDGVTFIALTAQVLPDEKDAILQSGFDGLLSKPFMEQDILKAIIDNASDIAAANQLDLSAIYKLTGDDAIFIRDTLASFISETENDLGKFQAALDVGDIAIAADILHRLASRSGQVGRHDLLQQARELELDLRNGATLNSIRIICYKLIEKINSLVEELTALT